MTVLLEYLDQKLLLTSLLKTKYALHTKIGVKPVFTPRIPYRGVDITPIVCITYYTILVCITYSLYGMY